jgi:hypothetical protein
MSLGWEQVSIIEGEGFKDDKTYRSPAISAKNKSPALRTEKKLQIRAASRDELGSPNVAVDFPKIVKDPTMYDKGAAR